MKTIFTDLAELRAALPTRRQLTLVGGCFDLLHVGHLHVLEFAASLGGLVVVGVLSDEYIRSYKGPERPIVCQEQRSVLVAALRCVDFVYLSGVSSTDAVILTTLKPDFIVFGEEAGRERELSQRIAKVREALPAAQIKLLPRYIKEAVSTSLIAERLKTKG